MHIGICHICHRLLELRGKKEVTWMRLHSRSEKSFFAFRHHTNKHYISTKNSYFTITKRNKFTKYIDK